MLSRALTNWCSLLALSLSAFAATPRCIADAHYVWDLSLVATSLPQGAGCGAWRSPEPIDISEEGYILTTEVYAVANLLPPLIGTFDAGVETRVTNFGPIDSLPFMVYDNITIRTNIRSFFSIMLTSIAFSHVVITITTNAMMDYQMSDFMITNVNLGTYVNAEVLMTAHTNEGRGIFLTAMPEPAGLFYFFWPVLLFRNRPFHRVNASLPRIAGPIRSTANEGLCLTRLASLGRLLVYLLFAQKVTEK